MPCEDARSDRRPIAELELYSLNSDKLNKLDTKPNANSDHALKTF